MHLLVGFMSVHGDCAWTSTASNRTGSASQRAGMVAKAEALTVRNAQPHEGRRVAVQTFCGGGLFAVRDLFIVLDRTVNVTRRVDTKVKNGYSSTLKDYVDT